MGDSLGRAVFDAESFTIESAKVGNLAGPEFEFFS